MSSTSYVRLLFANDTDCSTVLLGTSFFENCIPFSLIENLLLDIHLICLFLDITLPFHCGMPWLHSPNYAFCPII